MVLNFDLTDFGNLYVLHKYSVAGIYSISLELVDVNGDSDGIIKYQYIKVLPDVEPSISIQINATSIIQGQYILFNFTLK